MKKKNYLQGKSVALSGFYRIARNTMSMWFSKDSTPGPEEVENEFWRHVTVGTAHVCVHSGSIDTAAWGWGFPTGKERSSARHPWNLKILTNNPRSILRSLGPVLGKCFIFDFTEKNKKYSDIFYASFVVLDEILSCTETLLTGLNLLS